MRKIFDRFRGWGYFVAVIFVGGTYACANRGYPEGGPKDVTPPQVIAENPASYTRNFSKKKIDVYFDEFVQLKEINEKFIISPPLKKKPRVSLRGKYIQVSMGDTLKPNTTYSLDFADAIVDNNESNPLGFYRYVFSTGDVIDTLELSGNVVHAESGEPMLNIYVMLYSNPGDSLPLKELPDYVARTDSSGFFRLTNLREADYRVVAVEDANRDYKYTPEAEMVAFLDTVVHPVAMPLVRTDTVTRITAIEGRDTITSDSIFTTNYIAYGPNNLFLRLFQEKPTQLYLVDDDRTERERLDFVFSIPGQNDLKVDLWDSTATALLPADGFLMERTAGNDTIALWIRDSSVYKRDTLRGLLSYWRTDSTGQLIRASDTVRYTFKEKKKTEDKRKRDEKTQEPLTFLDIKSSVSGDLDIGGKLWIEFDRPVDTASLRQLQLTEVVDSVTLPVPFTYRFDSLKIRRIYIDARWEAGKEYCLSADSAALYDIYGRHNKKLEKKFKLRQEEYYGKVMLDVKGVSGNVIVQLYRSDAGKSDNGKRTYQVLREKMTDKDGVLTFDLLPEGKYRFRAILDENGNGLWDTGLYLDHRQPEEIIYLPAEISVKQNFDIEQEFDLQKPYKEISDK